MGSEYSDCIASEQYGLERLDHCLSFWKPHDCAVCLTRHTMFHTKLELALLQPPSSVGSRPAIMCQILRLKVQKLRLLTPPEVPTSPSIHSRDY